MVETNNRCPRCDGALQSDKSGSLTQWMFLCRCNSELPAEQINDTRLCSTCGKRKSEGRSGSLTQWVFGSSICSCENLESNDFVKHLGIDREAEESIEIVQATEEDELTVDPLNFPIDRYKPLAKLGSGAVGEVFLCRDRMLKNKVALKRLHQLLPEQLISFQNEARSTSSLHHPSIIDVRDFGATASGAPYMVMEYFPGEDLQSFLKSNGPLPWRAALQVVLKLADALESAHRNGIFHRDLKPQNVLLSVNDSKDVELRLIDFGIAKFNSANQTTTSQGVTLAGTPAYMSPDQASGLEFDARSEIYSLGCVLFETLTGRPPFQADTAMEALSLHINSEPLKVSDFVDVPPEIVSLVGTCLEKNPNDRFQSMADFAKQIAAIEETPVVTAGDGVKVASLPETSKSNVTQIIIAAVALLAVTATFVALFAKEASAPQEETPALKRLKAENKREDAFVKQNDEMDKVVDSFSKKTTVSPMTPITSVCNKGYKLLGEGKLEEAEKVFRTAEEECLKLAPKHPLLTSIRYNIASCLLSNQSRSKEAEELLTRVLADARNTSVLTAAANRAMATVYIQQGRYADAETLLEGCAEQTNQINALQTIRYLQFNCYWRQKKYDKVEKLLKLILADDEGSAEQRQNLFSIAMLLHENHDPRSVELCRRALAMRLPGAEDTKEDLPMLLFLRNVLIDEGRISEARPILKREIAVYKSENMDASEAEEKLREISGD